MNHHLDDLIKSSQRILLLQGPVGAFFADFADWLQQQQKTVFKINFNAGDDYFYPKNKGNVVAFQQELDQFSAFLTEFCQQHHIDNMLCFGDNRKYHRLAKAVANQLNIHFWAFEEGYFRPDYVTLEKSGVNAFSPIPKTAEFFTALSPYLPEPTPPKSVAKGFCPMAKCATQYYIAANLGAKKYPHYQNHKAFKLSYYLKLWAISGFKRLHYLIRDRSFAKRVEKDEFGDFFIVPLQVYDDSQVQVHADFASVADFLLTVLQSFAQHAPANLSLMIKHHPMDRGFIDYTHIIKKFIQNQPHLQGRVFYVHDVPLPIFLRKAKGMVTLNSTSGISALLHNVPVKTLGRANYDFAGLTDQGSLKDFWTTPTPPSPEVFNAYRQYHLTKTQLNGNFYSEVVLRFPY